MEDLCVGEPHANFRLWLSSGPHPKFPISILRRGVKMTTEPPAGLRANVSTLYNIVSPVREGGGGGLVSARLLAQAMGILGHRCRCQALTSARFGTASISSDPALR